MRLTGENWLAQKGYADSRPHSAPAVALLLEDFARDKNADLLALVQELRKWMQNESNKRTCICKMLSYVGESVPCDTCTLRSLIAHASAILDAKDARTQAQEGGSDAHS